MALQGVGGELPYFGAVRAPRTAPNDAAAFDEVLEEHSADAPGEAEPAAAPVFGGGANLAAVLQAMPPPAKAETAYLRSLERKFGDVAVLEKGETPDSELSGLGNVVIAENILRSMAAFSGRAEHYEERIRQFAGFPLAPQVRALLSGLGLEIVTLSALIIQTDGTVRYLFGGEGTSGKRQASWRSALGSLRRGRALARDAGRRLSVSGVRVQESQEASLVSEEHSPLAAGILMIVSFLESLPQPRRPRSRGRKHKKVEGITPRWLKGGQRQR